MYRNLRFFILISYWEIYLSICAYINSLPFRFPYRLIKKFVRKKKLKNLEFERFRKYCEHLPYIVNEPFFVKIGANDGISYDPCSDLLLKNKKWKGLLVEPLHHLCELLKLNFNDPKRFLIEEAAISKSEGEKEFYYVDPKYDKDISHICKFNQMLGSFSIEHILKHNSALLKPYINSRLVKIYSLNSILKKNNINKIHFLHIDAESHDYEVLKTLDFNKYLPAIILIEHKHLSNEDLFEMVNLMSDNGYEVKDCGLDYFALNRKVYYGVD